MAALVVVNPNRFRLPNAATKKAVRLVDYNYTIQISQKKNNSKKAKYCIIRIDLWKTLVKELN